MSFKEILSAPVSALSCVSEKDAEALKSAFGIKTVLDLANTNTFNKQERFPSFLMLKNKSTKLPDCLLIYGNLLT